MRGKKIKDEIISILVKFYEIAEGKQDFLAISIQEFSKFSNAEVLACLIALEVEGLIKLRDIRILRDDIYSQMRKYSPFEGNSVVVDITDKFRKCANVNFAVSDFDEQEVVYQITRNKREVLVNNFVLSKPNFATENDSFIEYALLNPNKKITSKEFEGYAKEKMKKKFERIITDLEFKGVLKKLFFPNISSKAIEFVNPITKKRLNELEMDYLNISEIIFSNKKK